MRRPSGFYQHLMKNEESPVASLPKNTQDLLFDHCSCLQELASLTAGASSNQNMPVTWHGPEPGIGLRASARLSQIPYSFDKELVTPEVFPEGKLDADLQQVDLRKTNSWRLKLGEIETTEMIEVQLVNSVAPFVLCNRLSEVMKKDNTGQKHIINVSAMEGKLDADLQQVDLRKTNSWRLKLGEIETTEMIEVQLVNSVAPFVLCNRLSEVMKKDNTGQKHIINVSAMEGKFYPSFKEDRHPHTNMAKAALNMLTHTSAGTLAKDGIFMNAVDTGWVTDEDPLEMAKMKEELHDFQPPLDIVDGAARVMDPLFDGINTGKHWCGKFLKDYRPISW